MKPATFPCIAAVTLATTASLFHHHGIALPQRGKVEPDVVGNPGSTQTEEIRITSNGTLPGSDSPSHPPITEVTRNHARQSSTGKSIQPLQILSKFSEAASVAKDFKAPADRGHAPDDGPEGTTSGPAHVANTPRTIQLSANFKLPAVLLAGTSPGNRGTHEITTPLETVTQSIVDDFYRNLAELPPADTASGGEEISMPEQVDENTIIEPDSGADSVRRHADELYRSLFGDEAFGRKGMESALEVRLPELSDQASQ